MIPADFDRFGHQLLAALLATCLGIFPAAAQQTAERRFANERASQQESNLAVPQRIVALVNDEPISAYDVVQRLRLTIASTGRVDSEEALARLQEQVVRNMVDDKLKLQEAAEFEVTITDDIAEDAFRRQAESMSRTPEQLEQMLAEMGVTKETYLQQMKAEIAWSEIVNGRLGPFATVAQDEVEQELQRIEANAGQPEYLVSEIYLFVDNPSREAEVRSTAERIVGQLRRDGNFAGFAQQFSQASTAAAGGSMDWVRSDQLSPQLAEVIETMQVGEISDPIRLGGGFYILQLRDRRRVLAADPLDEIMDLRHIFFPFEQSTTEEQIVSFVDAFDANRGSMTSCDDLGTYSAMIGGKSFGPLARTSLRDIDPKLRPLLQDLEIGEPSRPTNMQDGLHIFFICDRTKPDVAMPSFEDVIDELERRKLAMMARRYLRDLRRDAVVDYR